MRKICHLTSVHPRYDIRIFHKECKSIIYGGYDTNLIVADGKGDEATSNIKIWDIGRSKGRIKRMFSSTWKIYQKAIKINADLYHFHDPELLFVGYLLRRKGKIVIFDAHEDFPKQILQKTYLPSILRKTVAKVASLIDRTLSKQFSFIIAATPFIKDKYINYGCQSIEIMNYPILKKENNILWDSRPNNICYTGGITEIRGITNLLDAIIHTNYNIIIAGNFSDNEFEAKTKKHKGWNQVKFIGFVSQEKLIDVFNESKIGIGLFHSAPNHNNGISTKLYEYMKAGLPVIISNSVINNKKTVEKHNCGICVDPFNIKEVVNAIELIMNNTKTSKEMSINGQKAVEKYYNWSNEESKLIKLYSELLTK